MAHRERLAVPQDYRRVGAESALMDTPSWHRVKEIIEAALARPAAERAAFVLRACGDDTSLRTEVESLLAAMEQAGNFIEQPALELMSLSAAFPPAGFPISAGVHWNQGIPSGLTRSANLSAPGAWARSTGRTIPISIAMSH